MIIRDAREPDFDSFLRLAAPVEHWFGPMVGDPGFHRAVQRHIHRSAALLATSPRGDVLGGVLFGGAAPVYRIDWLVVAEPHRGRGIGAALVTTAIGRFIRRPATVDVVTFGADHPGASGARACYERLGFTPAESAPDGPEGGSRQIYRMSLPRGPEPRGPGHAP